MWRLHEPAINRALYSYEADHQLREDLAQEVFCAIDRSINHLKLANNQKAYIYRIVHNVAVDHIAKHAKHPTDNIEPDRLTDLHDSQSENEASSLDAKVQQEQHQALLLQAIRQLKPAFRQVMILMLEDLNSEEIAEILKINSGAVRTRINRAKIELKEKLSHVIQR